MLEGPTLRPCRTALADAVYEYVLPQGALVLVNPEHYLDATRALVGIEPRPFHLIVEESLEYLIEEVLAGRATQSQCRPLDAS